MIHQRDLPGQGNGFVTLYWWLMRHSEVWYPPVVAVGFHDYWNVHGWEEHFPWAMAEFEEELAKAVLLGYDEYEYFMEHGKLP